MTSASHAASLRFTFDGSSTPWSVVQATRQGIVGEIFIEPELNEVYGWNPERQGFYFYVSFSHLISLLLYFHIATILLLLYLCVLNCNLKTQIWVHLRRLILRVILWRAFRSHLSLGGQLSVPINLRGPHMAPERIWPHMFDLLREH